MGPVEVVEIAPAGEESLVQVAGTTLHELGHVLAGWGAGQGAEWKRACERLGLRRALGAGQCNLMALMAPEISGQGRARTKPLSCGKFALQRGCLPGALRSSVSGVPQQGDAPVRTLNGQDAPRCPS